MELILSQLFFQTVLGNIKLTKKCHYILSDYSVLKIAKTFEEDHYPILAHFFLRQSEAFVPPRVFFVKYVLISFPRYLRTLIPG